MKEQQEDLAIEIEEVQALMRDGERYRWLIERGFYYAEVALLENYDHEPYIRFKLQFDIPESIDFPYEEDEWTNEQIGQAIDVARRKQ